ncbi:hypothetical protein HAV22_10915 [Massilia sp. TW-1]|uniref:Uncharacterized protein n=1 Tax=Telluria antibiotica TaxID=2717319 RepID=A0ABX0PDL2_9BURK|nr:hypothetical protein [Telluria antibiotica]NIA54145.1 hypothetical protein [Telluria antibiotica]
MQLNLNKVLQDIGMVTRVEGVAVAEHRDSNLIEAVPVLRTRARADRHYPPDTPPAQQWWEMKSRSSLWPLENSGSEHLSPRFGVRALLHTSSCSQLPCRSPRFPKADAGAPRMARASFLRPKN